MRGFRSHGGPAWSSQSLALAALLACAVVFGGASRQHELRLAIVELTAVGALLLSALALLRAGDWPATRLFTGLMIAIAATPLLQLLPLPAAIWTAAPGRAEAVLALRLAGLDPGWAPLSLTPDETWKCALALLPPAAMAIGVLTSPQAIRMRLVYGFLGLAILAICLGAAQLASGGEQLYPWRTTNAGSVVGFFANRNHMATMCLMSMPFAAVAGGRVMRGGGRYASLAPWLTAAFLGLVLVALAVTRSRAGIVLAGPVLISSLIATWLAAGRGKRLLPVLAIGGVAALSVAAAGVAVSGKIVERFVSSSDSATRFANWRIVADASEAYLPLGSGIGSFDAVFRSVEPVETLDWTFFNHAHNEYLEILLETGWIGVGLLAVFLFWYAKRSWSAWRGRSSPERDLQRAASIGIMVVLLHSIADYPVRTAAIATLLALCCALLDRAARAAREPAPREAGGPPMDPDHLRV